MTMTIIIIDRFVDGQRANGFDRDFFVIANISQSYHMAIVKCEVFYVYWVFLSILHLYFETKISQMWEVNGLLVNIGPGKTSQAIASLIIQPARETRLLTQNV